MIYTVPEASTSGTFSMTRSNKDIIIAVLAASTIASVFGNISDALALHLWVPGNFSLEAFTCHLVHWTPEHLFYDSICFAALASNIRRKNLLTAILLCAPLVALSVSLTHPEMDMYGGLSGLNCALYPIAIWELLGAKHQRIATAAIVAALLKTIAEIHLGCTFFATSGFAPIHEAHIAGLAAGCLFVELFYSHNIPRFNLLNYAYSHK